RRFACRRTTASPTSTVAPHTCDAGNTRRPSSTSMRRWGSNRPTPIPCSVVALRSGWGALSPPATTTLLPPRSSIRRSTRRWPSSKYGRRGLRSDPYAGLGLMSVPSVSIKGVVIHDGAVLLLLNERGEWDLPGGRPDPGEDHRAALTREVGEEAGLSIEAGALLDEH